MSAEERAELEARLAADDDADDDSDEVTISHGGQTFTGTWRRALGVAAAWGVKLVADPPAPAKDDKGEQGGGQVKRFQGQRRIG